MSDKESGNVHMLENANIEGVTASALERIEKDVIGSQAVIARMRRASFNAHTSAGFTDAESLRLCIYLSATNSS